MNRTGLIIALAVAAVTGVVFGVLPRLDLDIAGLFFFAKSKQFIIGHDMRLHRLRDISTWIVAAVAAPAAVALIVKILNPKRRLLMAGRAVIFLLVTLALAPGVMANLVLKDHWGRSRPIDVGQFGGNEHFVAWWDPRGDCPGNCSFVSGESSGAFWTLAPAALASAPWRALAYAAAIAFGAAVSSLRMAFGSHFFSDVVFSGVFTFLIIWTVHGLLYRWRATRITDAAVESAIERLAIPVHVAAVTFLRRVGAAAHRIATSRFGRRA
jgi:lipid A 4'-phosphatase